METTEQLVNGRRQVMTVAISYILISVLAGAIGQITVKYGKTQTGEKKISVHDIVPSHWKIGTNPYVIGCLTLYVCGTVFWLAALSRVDLSYAYPFASVSYVIMLTASWLLFNENITPLRLAGTLIVMFGVFLISRSG